jgi:hypothetical protein
MRLWRRHETGLPRPSKTPQTSRSTAATPGSRRRKRWKSPPLTHHTWRLRAERIFINVGGRALAPPMPGTNEVPYLTNSSMMDVDFLPRHLIIVGGSYIGLDGSRRVQAATSAATFIQGGPNGQNGRRDHPGRA